MYAQIRDPNGMERFRPLPPMFYRGVDACILVFDLNNATTFENLTMWKADCLAAQPPDRPALPFVSASYPIRGNECVLKPFQVVFGNKRDLGCERQVRQDAIVLPKRSHADKVIKISSEDAMDFCKANGNMAYFELSASNATDVEDAFDKVASLALAYREGHGMSNKEKSTISIQTTSRGRCF
jgi:Ras-related protein Rab-7A